MASPFEKLGVSLSNKYYGSCGWYRQEISDHSFKEPKSLIPFTYCILTNAVCLSPTDLNSYIPFKRSSKNCIPLTRF